jgi:hypothetical protein
LSSLFFVFLKKRPDLDSFLVGRIKAFDGSRMTGKWNFEKDLVTIQ